MKLKVKEQTYDVDARELIVVMEASVNIDSLGQGSRHSFQESFEKIIANEMAQKVLNQYESEILRKVDIEAIIKRVQLIVVDKIARGH